LENKSNLFNTNKILRVGEQLIDLSGPRVMGIVNVTPDSFYDGGKYKSASAVLQQVEHMLEQGATFIDIGGYSTRPGADELTLDEEKKRVLPTIEQVSERFPDACLSIDTFNAPVARAAVEAGAHLVNDVSGGNLDEQMFKTVADLKVPYVLMHMRGTPQTMKTLTQYDNLVNDIAGELQQKISRLQALDVTDIIIDPGFGFAKTIDQNFELLRQLSLFQLLELPLLAGLSRKSMIYKRLKITSDEALNGTTALNMVALINGASILRVHDVREAMQTVELYKQIYH
jgi:dihydropteroate synthase